MTSERSKAGSREMQGYRTLRTYAQDDLVEALDVPQESLSRQAFEKISQVRQSGCTHGLGGGALLSRRSKDRSATTRVFGDVEGLLQAEYEYRGARAYGIST